jgi:hypothetical protein
MRYQHPGFMGDTHEGITGPEWSRLMFAMSERKAARSNSVPSLAFAVFTRGLGVCQLTVFREQLD